MKIRMGFVSNSSSASFIISLSDLNEEQLDYLKEEESLWSLDIDDYDVTGTCNDDFHFKDIISKEIVEWTYS